MPTLPTESTCPVQLCESGVLLARARQFLAELHVCGGNESLCTRRVECRQTAQRIDLCPSQIPPGGVLPASRPVCNPTPLGICPLCGEQRRFAKVLNGVRCVTEVLVLCSDRAVEGGRFQRGRKPALGVDSLPAARALRLVRACMCACSLQPMDPFPPALVPPPLCVLVRPAGPRHHTGPHADGCG